MVMDHQSHSHFLPHHSHHNNHRARYAPLPPHHHHQQPAHVPQHLPHPPPPPAPLPPPPPPPQLPSYRTIHTPPPAHPHPYNNPPHQSPFPFNTPNYGHHPVEDDRPISNNHHLHGFTHSPRVSNRILIEEAHPRRSLPDFDRSNPETRIGAWNPPPRVVSDNRPSRPYPSVEFDLDLRQRPLDHATVSTYPPIDNIRYDPAGGSSRLRMERVDAYEAKARDEYVWGRGDGNYHRRGDFASNLDASNGGFGVGSSQNALSRDIDIDSKSAGYVNLYDSEISRGGRREGLGDSKRWVNDRKGPRDMHDSSFELRNNEIAAAVNGDDFRIMSGKREYYGSELGRYNNRGSRECAHEFTRTPKKQIQKKSALLRIQTVKPNHRNRDIEQLRYTGYAADSNSNFFRGKDQHGYLGYGMKAEERQGSPVELDISFESNSLVAKAIVAPSSSAIVSDTNMTPVSDTDLTSTEKKQKVLVSDTDHSGLQPAKAVNLSSSPYKGNDTSSCSEDLKLQKNVSDACSQPCSSATHNSHGKNEVALSDEIIKVCSGPSGRTSPRVVKKKKIVKKLVKKVVVNSNSTVSNSPSANMLNENVQADNVTRSSSIASDPDKIENSPKEKSTTVDEVSMPVCLQSLPDEGNLFPENKKGDESLLSLGPHSRSPECKTDEDSYIGKVVSFEGVGNISNSPSCASSPGDKKSDPDCLDANHSVHGLLSIPNTDKVSESLNGSNLSDINHMDDVHMQLCLNEVSQSPGKYSNAGSPQNRHHIGDEMNCLSSSADNVINTDLINTCNSANDRVTGLSSNDPMCKLEDKFTVSDGGNDSTVCKVYCGNKSPTITKYAILEENSDTAIPVPNSGMAAFTSSRGTRIQEGSNCLQNASVLQGSDNGSTNLEDNITVPSGGIMNNAEEQVSPSKFTELPENCEAQTFTNSNISVGFGEGETNRIKKGEVRTHLQFSSSEVEGIPPDPLNPVSHGNVVDTTSNLSFKDSGPSEVLDQPIQSLGFSPQSCIDGVTALHGKRKVLEAEFYVGNDNNGDANKVSPMSKKKKVTAGHKNFTQCQSEFTDAIVVTTSCAEAPTSFSDNQAHQKEEVALSSMPFVSTVQSSTAQSMAYPEDIAKLSENILVGGSFESMDANRQTTSSDHLESWHTDVASYSLPKDLAIPNVQFPMLEGKRKENAIPIVPISNTQTDTLVIGNIEGEKMDLQAVEENFEYRDLMQRSPIADVESNDVHMNHDLLPQQNLMSCPADGDGVTTSNSYNELVEDVPDALSDMCSQGITSEVPDRRILDCLAINNESICGDEENLDTISVVEHGSDLPGLTSSTQHAKKITKSDHATGCSNLIMRKTMPQESQVYSKVTTLGLNSYCSELNGSRSQSSAVISRTYQGQSFTFSKSKASTSSTSKPRTWHRTGSNSLASLTGSKPPVRTVPPNRPILERKGNFQNTSYIRKGNSLVRKSTPVSALPQISSTNQSPSLGLDEFQSSTRSESSFNITEQPNDLKTGVANAPMQRQRTPPLSIETELEENRSSLMVESLSNGCSENASDPRKLVETIHAPNSSENVLNYHETPENQTGLSNNGENQVEANDGNVSSLNSKRMVYIKPKTNQLVATSNSSDLSVPMDDKAQTAFADGYYKRCKNQLVRTTFQSHVNQTVAMQNSTVNSDRQGACKVLYNRRFSKRRSHKVARSSCKPLRASLVWTLRGKSSSKQESYLGHYQKFLPHLFPWKRATYLRSFTHNPTLSSNNSSLSAISKKLLLLRKRDTVYTRSTNGFSLWKSQVLGVGGSSLKWSKSIERNSKQANEEATLAVAAVERKRREQKKDAASVGSQAKRERVFRIGLVRYRMDPSRRTIQRISDDESLSSASTRSGLAAKSSYIPRRLVIGNNEYVRIGNGNQLIRDPKKWTRILANEKVRWSLHTARQRLARKQKYCQFFTRFGKCNKDDGKCPYIHDPSKIAVCTKFLNGFCSTPNCKLTHKVIPERMPDCSYFLQGLCTNRNCPYRHVNVNPKASICEGFLRGYCADGNECRKKHSYVCPTFEATGTCTEGTKCKLHHPKKQTKGKKRKRSGDQSNNRGRYFGSIPIDVSQPGMMVAPRQCPKNDDLEGELTDFISLEVDEEVAESVDQSFEQATLCAIDKLDLQLDNLDDLIKPLQIMKKSFTAQSSPVQ